MCLYPSLRGVDTDIDCWITTPLPESIKSLHRIDLAGEESGSGDKGGGQSNRTLKSIDGFLDSLWPTLSVLLYCVLRNRREKLMEQTVLSIVD